jgi:methylated-DNA-[protein]-cysteine S-methyltransferase
MKRKKSTVFYGCFLYKKLRFILAASEKGLCRIMFSKESSLRNLTEWVARYFPQTELMHRQSQLDPCIIQLDEYFKGRRQTFDLALDLKGTSFQNSVWRVLLNIPYGSVKSYSEIAKEIGRPKAVRAVGNANAANPVPIIVPCHRVIAKNGTLGGYNGGLDIKKELLGIEGLKNMQNTRIEW